MNYLVVTNLSKTYGDKPLFKDISFSIEKGQKVALIAQNGTGKTTLLRILAGQEVADGGEITLNKGISIGYLSQDPQLNPDHTVIESLFDSDNPAVQAIKKYEESLLNPDDQDLMADAFEDMNRLNLWEYDDKVHQILETLDIHELTHTISGFSGGQKKRVALAKLLINQPDLIIMDEPTNHLDLAMIDWLEEYLIDSDITLLMVTHDRYFLERICDQILELDQSNIYKYKGNYSYFLEQKTLRESVHNQTFDKTSNLLRKELEWVKKSPRGRSTKSTARVDSYFQTKANIGQKIVEQKVQLDVKSSRLGGKILEIYNLNKKFGERVILDKFNYKFRRGERIGIIGNNGVGKTTFLNLITGKEEPDSGKIVTGETVVYGYYSQGGMQFKEGKKVIEVIMDIAEYIPLSNGQKLTAAKMLERFLFTGSQQYTAVSKLSGGEKRRLYLLTVLMKNPNFLILDEPTNDLDIMTLNVLEEFLMEFGGCLIIVTHDRYFMDKLVDHLFVFKGNGEIKDFPGNYSTYIEKEDDISKSLTGNQELEITHQLNTHNSKPTTQSSQPIAESSLNKEELTEYKKLPKEIETLEKKKEKLSLQFGGDNLDYQKISKISEEIKLIEKEIEKKSERWLVLSERA